MAWHGAHKHHPGWVHESSRGWVGSTLASFGKPRCINHHPCTPHPRMLASSFFLSSCLVQIPSETGHGTQKIAACSAGGSKSPILSNCQLRELAFVPHPCDLIRAKSAHLLIRMRMARTVIRKLGKGPHVHHTVQG